jgi:hypothetical protein
LSGLSSHALRWLRGACLALVVSLAAAGVAAEESAHEFWPETDLWLRLSPAWRLSSYISLSRNIETDYREGNVLLQADYGWGKKTLLFRTRLLDEGRAQNRMNTFLLRGGYVGGRSLDDHGEAYEENTMLLELHARTPLKGGILLSNRLRTDLRWLGDAPDFSCRVRYRLMVEKEIKAGSSSIVPYVNVEPYYDSRYETVNRVRLVGGATVAWMSRFALEGDITYQHDTHSSATNLYALNVILHVFFEPFRREPGT